MKKILIIEDDAALKNMYKSMLSDTYELKFERSGELALSYLSENKPDLIITDLNLVDMKGIQIVAALQAVGILSEIPVVVLTNFDDQELINQALRMGVKNFAPKSDIDLEDLISMCKKALTVGF